MKVLAFAGSTSSTSINRQLANFAAGLIKGAEVTQLDLRDFDLPIYSSDEEASNGIPKAAMDFLGLIQAHDAIVVSLAEHNGSYSTAFKNLYDWASRAEQHVWNNKPMLLMATSPGGRGGATVLAAAEATFPRMGADLRATFSLPSFFDSFLSGKGPTDPSLAAELQLAASKLE